MWMGPSQATIVSIETRLAVSTLVEAATTFAHLPPHLLKSVFVPATRLVLAARN
jgi:hypothetical protein